MHYHLNVTLLVIIFADGRYAALASDRIKRQGIDAIL
jgi:hypothetical protein